MIAVWLLFVLLTMFFVFLVMCFVLYVVLPIAFKFSKALQRTIIFANVSLQTQTTFRDTPPGVRNIRISFEDNGQKIILGIWHVLPSFLVDVITDFDGALSGGNHSVVIYFHGNGETRKNSELITKVLAKYFHVIKFDYRGFGDSTKTITNENDFGVDSEQIYNWVRSKTNKDIYLWGNSMGAAIAILATIHLKKTQSEVPMGLVLGAPFTSLRDAIPVHFIGKFYAWLPWFEDTILKPLHKTGFRFESSIHIQKVDCPVMVLHAEDDTVVPCSLGKKLVSIARRERGLDQGDITFHQIEAKHNCQHNRLDNIPDIDNKIKDFIEKCIAFKNSRSKVLTSVEEE